MERALLVEQPQQLVAVFRLYPGLESLESGVLMGQLILGLRKLVVWACLVVAGPPRGSG